MSKRKRKEEKEERVDERIELEIQRTDLDVLEVLHELHEMNRPRLSSIKVAFTHAHQKEHHMSTAVQGPAILTAAGQVAIATVLGFDQLGAPMPADFKMPIAAFSSDDTTGAIVISKDNSDGTDTVTAVANGVANITGEVISAEGKSLIDTESVTVAIVIVPPPPPPTPVLSSIKLAFTVSAPAPPATGGPVIAPGPAPAAAKPVAGETVRFAGPQQTGTV